jgi:hypothetical protein
MKKNMLKYITNASIIFVLIIAFAYVTTCIHELGHAIMVLFCGGEVMAMYVNSPLSFDSISGYILTNIPYNVPIVIGGTLATTVIAIPLYLYGRSTIMSYMTLCLSVSTLYNGVYALTGFNDFTWLVQYSWLTALMSLGLIIVNLAMAHKSMKIMLDDIWEYRTFYTLKDLASAIVHPRMTGSFAVKEVITILWQH